ncbi:MAG TPA: PilW family protein [Steroidobacteraceae bacterium]|nr:PilW family protein [Steroidobacteraceae bacterium]
MSARKHRGFSLVELMVAMVISVIIVDAAVSLFLANRQTGNTTAATSAIADNGRIAMSFISEAVRSGGYMACNATNDVRAIVTGQTRQISIISPGPTPVQRNYLQAFGGYEAAGTLPNNAVAFAIAKPPVLADGTAGDWINAGGLDAALVGKVTKGSDVLVVRESLPQSTPIYTTSYYATGSGIPTLNVDTVGTLTPGQYAVISDCSFSTAFQVGAVNAGALTIGTAGAQDLFGGDLKLSYTNPASITPVNMYIYFIGPGRDTDSSLWVYDESQGPPPAGFFELVPDVENMQVLYGIAPTNPNQATQYVTADAVVDFNQVVAVKVALLVASPLNASSVQTATALTVQNFSLLYTTVTPPLDARLRKVFDTTIAVRSAAL